MLMSYRKFMHIYLKIQCSICGILRIMNIVDLGFHMIVQFTLTNGLIGHNLCRYNDTQVR